MSNTVSHTVLDDRIKKIIEKIKRNPNKKDIISFLSFYIDKLQDFLEDKLSDSDMADIAINIFVVDEELSNKLEKFDPSIKELTRAMDLTHPEWTKKYKKEYVLKLKAIAYTILNKYKN